MNKTSKNQKGFTVVEGLLIILILVVIAGLGYMVYQNNHKKTAASSTSETNTSSQAKATKADDAYTGWQTYTDTDFNFKYPSDWSVTSATAGQDNEVWGKTFSIEPNSVPTNTGAFVNPPASYATSNSYTITIERFTSVSDYLSLKGGINYNQPTPYNYLKTDGHITAGLFTGKYLTFLSQLNVIKNVTNKLPTEGLLTNQSYDGSDGRMNEKGFVTAKGVTYQITVDSTDSQDGDGYPSVFNMGTYTNTDLYKDTLLILSSIQ